MAARISIFHPVGRLALRANPFGKDVANLELFRALAAHGGFQQVDVLSQRSADQALLEQDMALGEGHPTRLATGVILDQTAPAAAGTLLRGQPDLANLAWMRRRAVGDRGYSLMGLIHTLAPPAMRQIIADALTAPTQPWDALICTSPAVQDNVRVLLGQWGEHLGARTGGTAPAPPMTPVIPLGVDAPAFARLADRPDVRARLRAEYGLAEDEALVLWVGRLSYYEKAFPQPMFAAAQKAAQRTGKRLHFTLAGWFPAEGDRGFFEAAARAHAPDVTVRFEDGNDRARLGALWAASDVFLSLVDNIQETFGITPLEAMAAGRPVVVSDWDGYRSTVRDGVEGFLIPTLGGPAGGFGGAMALRHAMEVDSYQAYVGTVAQHTAVNVERCAEALARLIDDPALRSAMGAAGRARVREAFDWPVVARQYHALADELAQIRGSAEAVPSAAGNPARGDPFADFAGFASAVMTPETRLSAAPGVGAADLHRLRDGRLESAFGAWRGTPEECAQAFDMLAGGPMTVREVLLTFPVARRRHVELSLIWMTKYGLLDWL